MGNGSRDKNRVPCAELSLPMRARLWLQHGVVSDDGFSAAVRDLTWQLYLRNVPEQVCKDELRWFLFAAGLPHTTRAHQHESVLWGQTCSTIARTYRQPFLVGLSESEFRSLWTATETLGGTERYRQLQFTFAIVQLRKAAATQEFDIHCRRLAALPGANSMTYPRRLRTACASGVIDATRSNHRSPSGTCRTVTVLIESAADEDYTSLDQAIVSQDLDFLSPYMRQKVRARAQGRSQLRPAGPVRLLALWSSDQVR